MPVDGNPHPSPQEQFHHPNQNNHVLGPVAFHLVQQENNVQDNQQANGNLEQAAEEERWGHLAMREQHNVDMEIQAGEFLELNDPMGPPDMQVDQHNKDDSSGITLSLGLPGSTSSAKSVGGGHNNPNELQELLAPLHVLALEVMAGFDLSPPAQLSQPEHPIQVQEFPLQVIVEPERGLLKVADEGVL